MKIKGSQIAFIAAASITIIVVALVWQSRSESPIVGDTEEFLTGIREKVAKTTPPPVPLGSIAGTDTDASLVSIIELDSTVFDMGLVTNKGITTRDVPIHNRGKVPLKIRTIKTECGCTQGRMVNDVIPPGETGIMRVALDPAKVPGFESTKTLTIFSNDPKHNPIRLAIHVQVEPEIEIEPSDRVIDFGEVNRGEPVETVLIVRQLEDTPFNITEIKPFDTQSRFDVTFEERPENTWKTPGKKEYLIKVTLAMDLPVGPINARFDIHSNLERVPVLPRHIKANIISFYKVNPKFVMLRDVVPGQTRENILSVSATRPIEVSIKPLSRDEVKLAQREGENPNSYVYDLSLAADASLGSIREKLELTIKAGDKEFTEIVNLVVIPALDDFGFDMDDDVGSASKIIPDE